MKIAVFFFIGLCVLCLLHAQTDKPGFITVTAKEFSHIIKDKNTMVCDVRTPQEYAEGYIKGAILIDVQSSDFDSKISDLDTSKTLAVYCRSGRRSITAAEKMAKKGFKVYMLDKGIQGWKEKIVTPKKEKKFRPHLFVSGGISF